MIELLGKLGGEISQNPTSVRADVSAFGPVGYALEP